MKITINHNGRTNADILGANVNKVEAEAIRIMALVEAKKIFKYADIFVEILMPNGLNDAEKLILFHTIRNLLSINEKGIADV